MIKNFSKLKAFTLAEVLITLGIIGLVAAVTIPTVTKQYQRIILKSKFAKAYSLLQNVVIQWEADEGEGLYSAYHNTNSNNIRATFFKYFNGERDTRASSELKPYYTSIKDSTTIIHYCPIGCCVNPAASSLKGTDGIMYNICNGDSALIFAVDLNGNDKAPNKWGIDLFGFYIYSDNKFDPLFRSWTKSAGCSNYLQNESHINDGISCTYYAVQDQDYFKKINF